MSHLARADSWVAWEPLAGEGAAETLTVFRPAVLSGVSWVVAFLFLLGAWSIQRSRLRGRYALLLLWLAANGLAFLWSPESLRGLLWWPLLAGVLVAALWFICVALSSRPRSGSSAPAGATTTLLVLLFSAALASQAAAPGPETVLLLPGPANAPAKETALVAPDLLKRLESLARRGAAGLRGAFLSGARYEGAVLNGAAEITAEFQIDCFSEEAAPLDLPLGGVELLEAKLDDAPAYPTVLAAPRTGYALLVKGRGPHVARLRFSVPLAAGEEDRELRFTIPELIQSRLQLTVPPGATYLQTLLGRGAQQVSANEKQTILTADLGRVPSVAAYWRQPKSPPALPSVQVTEHYLWTLQGSTSRLQAVLQYAVTQGAATVLALALPDNLEVRQVRVSSSALGSLAPKLKQWTVAGVGNERRLHLEFQAPITNGVQVALELLSSVPPGPVVALALPRPLGAAPAAGASYIGYRVQGWQAEPGQFNRITGIQQDEFNQLWELAEPEDREVRADRAYSFRRTPDGDPSLQLQLRAPRNELTCWQSLVWQVSEERVDLRGTARIARPSESARQAGPAMPVADRKPFALVEWEVPAEIIVTHIGGKDVRSWSRLGPRIQIWLQGGVTTTAVELAGWLPRPAGKRLEPFHLPHLFVTGADPHWTLLRIAPGTGLTLRPGDLQHLWPVPALGRYSRQQLYLSRHAAYDGFFHVGAGEPVADVRMLTVGELVNHALSFSSTVDHHIRRGELDSLTLRLRNGEGAEVHFEAAHLAGQREHRTDAVHRSWTLDLNPGATGRYRVLLVGRLQLEPRADAPFPAVSIEGPVAEHLLVLLGSNLETLEPRGLSAITNP
ncbi:MAG TPA: hypothetical protein VKI17_04760, partial [Gemmataceae bacterium]|nr:hypothetical protein [Gemmataceae bacterium]